MSCAGATNTILGQYFDIKSKDFTYSLIQVDFWQYFPEKYGNTVQYNRII